MKSAVCPQHLRIHTDHHTWRYRLRGDPPYPHLVYVDEHEALRIAHRRAALTQESVVVEVRMSTEGKWYPIQTVLPSACARKGY